MGVHQDIGPSAVPGWQVYAVLREIAATVQVAQDCAKPGSRQDLPRARLLLDRIAIMAREAGLAGSGD